MFYRLYNSLRETPPLKGTVFLAALISCYAACINGYPILYPDTGTYILSGYEPIIPPERPIFYGLFIYVFSTTYTLFPVVFMQGLVVCFLLDVTMRMFFSGAIASILTLLSATFLTLFTSFSFIVCTLVPDIFTPIVLLCVLNLLVNGNLGLGEIICISVILVFALCTQFSSLYATLISLFVLLIVLGLNKLKRKQSALRRSRIILTCLLVLAPFLVVPLANYSRAGKFTVQSVGPVFFINHTNEIGLLNQFLREDCSAGAGYKLCAYRDSSVWDFIWQPNSPFTVLGGWDNNQEEYRHIMWEMLTREKYLVPLIQRGVEGTVRQLFVFNVPLALPQRVGSAPYWQIAQRYSPTFRDYLNSSQYNGGLSVKALDEFQRIVLLFSLAFISVVCLSRPLRQRLSPELRFVLLFFILFMIVQAAFSANLSTIDSRYQSRVSWILPVLSLFCIPSLLKKENGR